MRIRSAFSPCSSKRTQNQKFQNVRNMEYSTVEQIVLGGISVHVHYTINVAFVYDYCTEYQFNRMNMREYLFIQRDNNDCS